MTPERAVSRVLFLGGFLAVALMIGGLAALELRALRTAHPLDIAHVVENREAGRSVDVFVSVPQLARALARWPPSPRFGPAGREFRVAPQAPASSACR